MTANRSKNRLRSPLKAPPLRLPGQSVETQRRKIWEDRLQDPIFCASTALVLAFVEWLRYWLNLPYTPWIYSAIAVGCIGYAVHRVRKFVPELRRLKLAREGEQVVGQYLESLREKGYMVYHDVVGEIGNVDHVVIGPGGVFTIETKTYSKAPGPEVRVRFDGERILVDGYEPDRNPVAQAQAQVAWIRKLLRESTGRDFPIRPVVLFPGWYVEQAPGSLRQMWVLEPKALPAFLEREPQLLKTEDVKLAAYHLSRYIRASQEN